MTSSGSARNVTDIQILQSSYGSGTVASGTALVGHHETSWYRIIGATHNQNATALALGNITGYNIRLTLPDGSVNPKPCFDCHGHEAMTNSNNDPASVSYDPAKATVYTDWAQSGHALGLLTAKYAAATANPVDTSLPRTDPTRIAQGLAQVDAVMAASVTGPLMVTIVRVAGDVTPQKAFHISLKI